MNRHWLLLFLLAQACCASLRCEAATPAHDIAERSGFAQRPGAQLPLALMFRDENARAVRLGEYFGSAPVLLVFTYFGCSNLCPTLIGNLAGLLARSALPRAAYRVLVVSIDPRDTPALAALKKARYLAGARAQMAPDWALLTGSAVGIAALTEAVGLRYAFDQDSGQYAHPAGAVVLTAQAQVSGYLLGFEATPGTLRAALDAAAAQRPVAPAPRLLLCFHFAPSGKYSATVLTGLRWMALFSLLALAAVLLRARVRRRAGVRARSAR